MHSEMQGEWQIIASSKAGIISSQGLLVVNFTLNQENQIIVRIFNIFQYNLKCKSTGKLLQVSMLH